MEDRQREDEVLKAITELSSHFKEDGIVPAIKAQVQKTNGRVTKLEQWRWMLVGGFLVITMTIGVPRALEIIFPERASAKINNEDLEQKITDIINKQLEKYEN